MVSDALREDIVAGYFRGDEKLTVAKLEARYGISAPPIREALSKLEVEGLVVIEPNRGARVRSITPAFVSEIFEIRILLESGLVEACVPLMRPGDIEDLAHIQDQYEAVVADFSPSEVIRLNWVFHTRIYSVRPNHEAMRLLNQHGALIATLRNRYGYDTNRLDQIIDEHRALLAACASGHAKKASAIARTHIEHSVADLLKVLPQA